MKVEKKLYAKKRGIHALLIYLLVVALTYLAVVLTVKHSALAKQYKILQVLISAGISFLPIIVYKIVRRESWALYGINSTHILRNMVIGVAIFALPMTVLFLVKAGSVEKHSFKEITIQILYYLIVAVFEELIFRGYMQTALINWVGPLGGLVLTGVLFSFNHLPQRIFIEGLPFFTALSSCGGLIGSSILLFGVTTYFSKNIYIAVFIHWLINSMGIFSGNQ